MLQSSSTQTPYVSLLYIIIYNSGVGAILSQRSASDQKLHPCSFFSPHLSLAEKNYDVGNQTHPGGVETLAGRAEDPFIVWMDHKNLAYIQMAKRLNFRKAFWALFFGRFSFTLTYQVQAPGISSQMLSPSNSPPRGLTPILTPSSLLPVWWPRLPGRSKP